MLVLSSAIIHTLPSNGSGALDVLTVMPGSYIETHSAQWIWSTADVHAACLQYKVQEAQNISLGRKDYMYEHNGLKANENPWKQLLDHPFVSAVGKDVCDFVWVFW